MEEKQNKLKILFAGSSEIQQITCIKGFDVTTCAQFKEAHTAMTDMLEGMGHDCTYIASHQVHPLFPSSVEELNQYDVVLFSNIGSNTFLLNPEMTSTGKRVPNLLKVVKEYVEKGGGFAMIGGYMSYQGLQGKANYKNTCIEEILPVTMLQGDDRIELPEGGDLSFDPERHRVLSALPGQWPYILGYNRLIAKENAEVIVSFENDPIITLGTFEKGRTMAYATDCSVHWVPGQMISWENYPILWENLLYWLAGE